MDYTILEVPDGLTIKQSKRSRNRAKRRAISSGSNELEGFMSGTQTTVVLDDPTDRGPIDPRSQQQEITKIREANRPTRKSGSPEVRIPRFFEKVPTVSHEETHPLVAPDTSNPPTEPLVATRDHKVTQAHPSGSHVAEHQSNGLNTHDPKPRYRDRMTQQDVNTSPVAGKKTAAQSTIVEGKINHTTQHEDGDNSEDELNGPITRTEIAASRPSPQTDPTSPLLFSDHEGTEPSSGEIKSKNFRPGSSSIVVPQQEAAPRSKRNPRCRYFPVDRIHTKLVHRDCDGSNDEIAFNDEHKAFEIWIDGTPIKRPWTSEVLRYTSNHFHAMWHCDDSLQVIIRGTNDNTSAGVLLFEFGNLKSKESFMGTIRNAFTQTRCSDTTRYVQSVVRFLQSIDRCDSSGLEIFKRRWANGLKQLQDAKQQEEANEKRHSVQIDEARQVPAVSPKRPNRVGMSSHGLSPDLDNNGDDTQLPRPSAQHIANSGQRQTYVIVEKQSNPARASTRVRTKPAKAEDQTVEREMPIERFRLQYNVPPWEEPLTYPFVGPKRTTVNFEDLDRIDEGDLLNDNIVNFCLRKGEYEHEELADKVFFFNTYFFSTLTTTRAGKRGFNYEAVKRWTKKVDLFSLPYVIVPINVSYHWYLVIICNLQNLPRGDVPAEEPQEIVASDEEMQDGHGQDPLSSAPQGDMPSKQFKRMSLDDEEVKTMPNGRHDVDYEIPDSDDERKKQAAYESALVNSQEDLPTVGEATAKQPKKKPAAPVRRWSPDQPLIITLDSLGAPHSGEVRLLKDYIVAEALDKRGLTIEPKQIQGITAKGIPEQTNLSDCGVFLIGYVEEFLKDPRRFVEKVCSKDMDRNNDFQDFEPKEKRNEIRDTLIKMSTVQLQNKEQERQSKKDAKRKAAEQAGGDAKRIASSPVKDSGETLEISDDKVSDLSISSPAKQSLIEMAIRGQTSVLEGIGDYL